MIVSSANNSLAEILEYGSIEQVAEIRHDLIKATKFVQELESDGFYDYADVGCRIDELEGQVGLAEDGEQAALRECEDLQMTITNLQDDIRCLVYDIRESAGSIDINDILERLEMMT